MDMSELFRQVSGQILGSYNAPAPYDLGLVRQGVNQSLVGPSVGRNLEVIPRRQGVSFNSPSRLMQAAMAAAGQAGDNANQRSVTPLAALQANAMFGLQQAGDREGMRANLNATGQSQFLRNAQLQLAQQSKARSMLMQMLSPMFSELSEGIG